MKVPERTYSMKVYLLYLFIDSWRRSWI